MLVFYFCGVRSSLVFSADNISSRINCSHLDLFYKKFILNLLKRVVKSMEKTIKVRR